MHSGGTITHSGPGGNAPKRDGCVSEFWRERPRHWSQGAALMKALDQCRGRTHNLGCTGKGRVTQPGGGLGGAVVCQSRRRLPGQSNAQANRIKPAILHFCWSAAARCKSDVTSRSPAPVAPLEHLAPESTFNPITATGAPQGDHPPSTIRTSSAVSPYNA